MNLIPTRFSKSSLRLALLCLVAFLPAALRAELAPGWASRVPLGTALGAGPAGIHVDPDGVSYVTGISGPSSNTDITTVSFAPDGSVRWSQTWNSVGSGADQARGITMGPGGILYVVGNTPGATVFCQCPCPRLRRGHRRFAPDQPV